MEAAIINRLPETMRPATKKSYAVNALKVYRLLHGKDPASPSTTFLNKPALYKRLPELVQGSTELSSAHSKYNVVNMAAALCHHLGYSKANVYLKSQVQQFKEQRDALMTQENSGEMLKANSVPYHLLLTRFKKELLPPFTKLKAVFTQEDRKIIIRALIGVMNVIEPNCRSALASCRVVHVEPKHTDMGNGKDNLMFVTKKGHVIFCCNTDKVSGDGKLGPDRWVLGDAASKVIRQSLDLWPRKYLFASDAAGDVPMSKWCYNHWIGECFTFEDRVASTNILRHSIVDFYYTKYHSPSILTKQWLARRMRHSIFTAEGTYRKVQE